MAYTPNNRPLNREDALKMRINKWLFSPKWTSTHTEFEEVEAIADLIDSELQLNIKAAAKELGDNGYCSYIGIEEVLAKYFAGERAK